MKFRAEEEQVRRMAANAINASSPMGLGWMHYDPTVVFDPKDVRVTERGVFLDYVDGRMVKLYVEKVDDTTWEINGEPRSDYQSWVKKYPTCEALAESVPGVIIEL